MIFKEIPYVKGYFISEDGKIYSQRTKKVRKYSPKKSYGEYVCSLRKQMYFVAELVASTYQGERDLEKFCVEHIDGNTANNHYANLRWVPRRKNLIYKPVPGYPNYEISEKGDVYNLVYKKHMVAHKDKDGYYKVHITKNKHTDTWFVHRLVAMTFLEKIEGCNIVNHLDSDRTNNDYRNLEWTTETGNYEHGVRYGNISVTGEGNPNSKLTTEQVEDIRRLYNSGLRVCEINKKYPFVRWETIKLIATNKVWKHIG